MKKKTLVLIAAAALASLSCASRPFSPIQVTANDFDVTPLIGKWSGDYHSEQTGRWGSIVFALEPGVGTAYGDVVMVPRTSQIVTPAVEGQPSNVNAMVTAREVLTIRFVRREGNQVIGTLDSYLDPDCSCRVNTTFTGVFKNSGAIEGTYRTVGVEAHEARGSGAWQVVRSKKL
jgi:hypothetical protein